MTIALRSAMNETRDVATRRAASQRLVRRLSGSDDPVLAYKASLGAGMSPESASARALQAEIPRSGTSRALMRVFEQDDKTLRHVYRKWQGPHWTLTCLAMIDYPPGDEALWPLVHLVYDWLLSKHFLEPPLTAIYPGSLDAAQRAAELVLARRLLWHIGDGTLITPKWGGRADRVHYPIQFYDVLFAMQVMAELGRTDDPRCADALALLLSKQLPDGGFPLEEPNAPSAVRVASRHSYADWARPEGGKATHCSALLRSACSKPIIAGDNRPARSGF